MLGGGNSIVVGSPGTGSARYKSAANADLPLECNTRASFAAPTCCHQLNIRAICLRSQPLAASS